MTTAKFQIDGMHCGGCVKSVTAVLGAIPGVTARHVDVGSADVEYDPASSSPEAVATALTKAGYPTRSSLDPKSTPNVALKVKNGGGCGCG